jgi:hypothetical protein
LQRFCGYLTPFSFGYLMCPFRPCFLIRWILVQSRSSVSCFYFHPRTDSQIRYSIVLSFSSDNAGDVREMFLIMAAHMLIGLFAKHGVASYQTLKTIYQRVRWAALTSIFPHRKLKSSLSESLPKNGTPPWPSWYKCNTKTGCTISCLPSFSAMPPSCFPGSSFLLQFS